MASKIISPGALRQRLHDARRKDGLVVVPVLALEIDLAEMLVARGYLSAADTMLEDPRKRRQALSDATSRWVYSLLTRQGRDLWPDVI